jgi:hypothetical protein
MMGDMRAQIMDEYMPSNDAVEEVLPEFEKFVDDMYQRIAQLPEGEEKKQAALRLNSVMFVDGVLIHPVRDGNGQTFKMLTLSYLHDLIPDMKDKYLPIKYSRETNSKDNDISFMFMGGGFLAQKDDLVAGSVPDIEPLDDKDSKLIQYIKKVYEAKWLNRMQPDEDYDDWNNRLEDQLMGIVSEASQDLGLPELAERVVARWETRGRFWLKKRIPIYKPVLKSFQTASLKYLMGKGYTPERVRATVYGPPGEKIDRASYAIRQLIGSKDGRQVTSDYVIDGRTEVVGEDNIPNQLYRKAVKAYVGVGDNINRILESKEDHIKRHEQMLIEVGRN